MLLEKSITVKLAEEKKKGTTNGKAWTLFKITDQDGDKYTTFESQLAQLGIPARIWYEESTRDWVNPEGKTIKVKDRTVKKFEIGAEFQGAKPAQGVDGNTDKDKLQEIWRWYQSVKDNQMPF